MARSDKPKTTFRTFKTSYDTKVREWGYVAADLSLIKLRSELSVTFLGHGICPDMETTLPYWTLSIGIERELLVLLICLRT